MSVSTAATDVELSVVMPCLNEADTLERCIRTAQQAMTECGISGEIIVADNGSLDGSVAIARGLGVRVVHVPEKGYGNALMGGISQARGSFILMADADDSYDFSEIPRFLIKLREGCELVQGCRFPAGGGRILPGAMPASHRLIGNPFLSLLARIWFRVPIHDVYCGIRAFTRSLYDRLGLRCTGMEFATEMIIKASLYEARFGEVPVTLRPDGRIAHPPHLRTLRDGWRTLRFFLLYCPRWLFMAPGTVLIGLGLIGYALALPGVRIGKIELDAHTLLFSSLALLCGHQAILFGILAKSFAVSEGLLPPDAMLKKVLHGVSLERGIVLGMLAVLAGAGLLLWAVILWKTAGFGHLDYAKVMRWVIPGATLTAIGFLTVLGSFLQGVFSLPRR